MSDPVPAALYNMEEGETVSGVTLKRNHVATLQGNDNIIASSAISYSTADDVQLKDALVKELSLSHVRCAKLSAEHLRLFNTKMTNGKLLWADVSRAKIEQCLFEQSRFSRVNAFRAHIKNTTFKDCQLDELRLQEATLQGVLFEGCDLTQAEFSNVTVRSVTFRACNLVGAKGVTSLRNIQIDIETSMSLGPALMSEMDIHIVES